MKKSSKFRGSVILSIIASLISIGIAAMVVSTYVARSHVVYIHPKLETVYLGEGKAIIDKFDIKNVFTFRPSSSRRDELAAEIGITEPLKDDDFLCCAIGNIIIAAYYQWPPDSGATGSRGWAVLNKVDHDDELLHIVRLRWPKNGFIISLDVQISRSEVEQFLKCQGHKFNLFSQRNEI